MRIQSKWMTGHTLRLSPGFTEDEVGPGARHARKFRELGEETEPFDVVMNPFYDSDADPRFKDEPELKAKMEAVLMKHPMLGKDFRIVPVAAPGHVLSNEEYAQFLALQKGVSSATAELAKKQVAGTTPTGTVPPIPERKIS